LKNVSNCGFKYLNNIKYQEEAHPQSCQLRRRAIAVQPFDLRNARLLFEKALLSYRLMLAIVRNALSKSASLAFFDSSMVEKTSKRAVRIRRRSKYRSARIRDCP
jgi:hypothetical protein